MRHFYFLLIFLMEFLFQTQLQAQSNVIDEVIWIIGDDAIFLSDVERMRLEYQYEGIRFPGDPYCVIPEKMAMNKLLLHQAKLDSIEVSDSEVYAEVEWRINNIINYFGSQEKVEEYFNTSISTYKEDLRISIKEDKTVKKVQQELFGKIKITTSDVRSFFKRIPEDSLPFIPTTVEVEIITIEPQISLEEIDAIKNRLRDFTEQVNSGEMQFSTLARIYSDDEVTANKGGEMGLLGRATLVPEFAIAAFDLNDTRRVSRIVQTEYGYHIIQLIQRLGDRINVRHILLREHITKDAIDAATISLDSIRNNIVEGKYSFEDATYFSNDKDTRANKGLMVNTPKLTDPDTPRSGTPRFEISELPPEIARVISNMQVSDISKPFLMISPKTHKEIVVIVKLKSRIEGHKASLSEDFPILKLMVEEEKQDIIVKNWIAKKQKETYIRIKDNWKNCDFEIDGWIQK